ncbi:unnamed protein product [Penicillium nalgiovense]|uniref:BTB domain transcription factor n=1 Tax=Penicillium nalgiovense TaxID=60175 RepID=A0A9W4MWE6_PENNA|nr:unnamed protein product [Penicillium nalgiovense]CAG7987871.1 unnamed protein product [Penicillium nalgiovense]CAG7991316.1 unnamed protein product [Penicillium nalgiovense]CAG8013544.1 unnamed protein product [Penicillium nalgiovense]CAG8014401.1 unnamed protein product [Penicillium nalgiovense]
MSARTSSRNAAQKAKEAISASAEPTGKTSKATKRKASTEKAPQPKKEKTEDTKPDEEKAEHVPDGPAAKREEEPVKAEEPSEAQPPKEKPVEAPTEKPQEVEGGLRKSEERESVVSSNILEKGFIYFFFRPRVNIEEPQDIGDVSRSFFVLRPTVLGAEFDEGQGPVDKDAKCRLMILPKKKYPTSPKERDMGFVEKAGQTMQELHEKFITGKTYETSTRGERHVEEARPYAEGVYAITSTPRASHLAYILTIPTELGDVQDDFGLQERGSWIVQSKSPKFAGPPVGRLPKDPEYPPEVLDKFSDLRWVPLQPEFLDYPNSQFLMIGEAQNDLGKAAFAMGGKQQHEEEPGQELEKLEDENEHRVDSLKGDETVYEDLGYHAKNYPKVLTTWNTGET